MKPPETTSPEEIPQIDLAGYSEGGLELMEIGLKGRAAELVTVADDCAIIDEKSLTDAIDITAQIKAAFDQIESERDQYTRPMLLLKRMADGKFKAITDPLQAAEARLKGMILTFQRAEQKKRDDAEAAQAKADREAKEKYEMEKAEYEAEKVAAKAGIVPPPAAPPEPPPPPPPPPPTNPSSYGNYGSKATRKSKWVHEVADLTDVPLKYLTVDDKAVKAAIKEGVREIPGIKIFDEGTVAFT